MNVGMNSLSVSLLALASFVSSASAAPPPPVKNVVLVHGGFVDGSGWESVFTTLTKDGYNVSVVQNPTTSLADDLAATKNAFAQQGGPTILVGHSTAASHSVYLSKPEVVVALIEQAAKDAAALAK
jgi:hypothetical protein